MLGKPIQVIIPLKVIVRMPVHVVNVGNAFFFEELVDPLTKPQETVFVAAGYP